MTSPHTWVCWHFAATAEERTLVNNDHQTSVKGVAVIEEFHYTHLVLSDNFKSDFILLHNIVTIFILYLFSGQLPAKQWELTACRSTKKFVLCSGYSSKSLLIISNVHSKRASNICGISLVICPSSLLIMVAMVLSTSGSRAAGTLRW